MEYPFSESYKIKMVEPLYRSNLQERAQWIKQADYNLFNLKSNQVYIDLLTDSGTGSMSHHQWAAMMQGDESYAGASSYFQLKKAVKEIFGFDYFLPTHQGRAAENVLFSTLVKTGNIIPGNSHFDTTKGHIEFRGAHAIDCTIDEAFDTHADFPFKGNVDIQKLENVFISESADNIPFVILTLTNNTAGGQPVSMQNMREVSILCKKYSIALLYDSARFAENAYFIKLREVEYKNKTIREIVTEMYSYTDMMTMSSKKDGIVNIGGLIGLRSEEIFKKASTFNIMFEGFISYGGMAGRDMSALAVGLNEVLDFNYLETRIKQVEYLGNKLIEAGIPIQKPIGGHAIFVNATEFLVNVPREQFVAQTLAIELYLEAGVRGVEIGTLLADRDPQTRQNRYPRLELLRLAIPRRVYTNNHMDVVAHALIKIFERRNEISSGFEIMEEAPILRHFTVKLKKN